MIERTPPGPDHAPHLLERLEGLGEVMEEAGRDQAVMTVGLQWQRMDVCLDVGDAGIGWWSERAAEVGHQVALEGMTDEREVLAAAAADLDHVRE